MDTSHVSDRRPPADLPLDHALALEALEHFPDAVTLSRAERDADGRPVDMRLAWMNARARAGQPDPAAAIGGRCSELWPQMVANGSFAACMRVLATGVTEAGEFDWTSDEQYLPAGYDYKATRIGDDWLLWVLRDSTARVRQALASEAELRAMFDRAPQGVAVIAADGTVVRANAPFARLLQATPDEIVGSSLLDRCPGSDRDLVVAALAAPPEPAGDPVEVRMIAERGLAVPLRLFVSALPAHGDGAALRVVHMRDISTELHLRDLERVGALAELAGGVAHDFNNLLVVIGSNAELARDVISPDGPIEELDAIGAAVQQAALLTRQILTLARRQAPVAAVDCDVNRVVADCLALLKSTLAGRIAVESYLDPTLPCARADAAQLGQLLVNLAVNARDAMPAGGRLLVTTSRVDVSPDDRAAWPELAPGGFVRLTVADTGSGMAPEVRARALEPYFTTKPRGRGTGLGLATAQALVQRAGGAIRLYSEVGKGTVVRVLLPVVDDAVPAPEAVEESPVTMGRVLVVDDEPTFATLAARLLEGHVAETATASSATAALAALAGAPFDILLTDVVLPDLSGPELARRALAVQPGLAVTFMSGFTDGLLAQGQRDQPGGQPLVEKPFTRADLLRGLRRAKARAAG